MGCKLNILVRNQDTQWFYMSQYPGYWENSSQSLETAISKTLKSGYCVCVDTDKTRIFKIFTNNQNTWVHEYALIRPHSWSVLCTNLFLSPSFEDFWNSWNLFSALFVLLEEQSLRTARTTRKNKNICTHWKLIQKFQFLWQGA